MDNLLNLDGIPDPIARGLEVIAEMARVGSQQQRDGDRQQGLQLSNWNLGVIGEITREAIQDNNERLDV